MKKLSIYLSIVVGLFIVLFVLNNVALTGSDAKAQELYNKKASQLNRSTVKQLDDENYQNIILPEDLKAKLENKEDVFVYFFSPDCPFCQRVTPMLYPLSQETGIDMKQFNVLEFPEYRNYNIVQWPTLVYFEDGVEADRLVGEKTEEEYRQFFEKYR